MPHTSDGQWRQAPRRCRRPAQLTSERVTVERLELVLPIGGQRTADVCLDVRGDRRGRATDKPLDDLVFRQRPTQPPQDQRVDPDRDAFAVDEHSVAVEDHQLDWLAHERRMASDRPIRCCIRFPTPLRFDHKSSNIRSYERSAAASLESVQQTAGESERADEHPHTTRPVRAVSA